MKLDTWRSLFGDPKLIFIIISLSAIGWCLPVAVQSKSSIFYGLGIIYNQKNSAGQTRCADFRNLVAVNLLAPDDGAKTLSSRPTFYWYIEHKSLNDEKSEKSFYLDFFLRGNVSPHAKSIYTSRSNRILHNNSGLYKFTLPPDSPSLEVGQTYTWHIRYIQSDGRERDLNGSQIDTRAIVLLESNPSVMKQINEASTDLEKARIFASNRYWYDALDAYTKWIEANPSDPIALRERLSMLDEIIERNAKQKCAVKYNIDNSSLVNSTRSIEQVMK